jgi:alkylation response protein AidB-like acyl-CoA dehydrogenase
MDCGWTTEQDAAYEAMLSAVAAELGSLERQDDDHFSREEWQRCGKLGLLGLCVPQEYGGSGLGATETARMMQAFGFACPDMGLVFAAGAHLFACARPLAAFGGSGITRRWLPSMCAGELITGNAMTEPDAGSDTASLVSRAVRSGAGYVLSGRKSFVSNGPLADLFLIYATTEPDAGFLGVTCFLVEADRSGLTVGPPFGKMGLSSCPASEVILEDCWVPADQVVGGPGRGYQVFQHAMAWERCCLFAGYLGLMDRLVAHCVRRARERRQFGRPVGHFQAVAHRIADMTLCLESARLLLYHACWQLDRGEPARLAIALAKLAVSESAVRLAVDAMRLFGADGYRTETGIEAAVRDSLAALTSSGTSDIQREIVAKELALI